MIVSALRVLERISTIAEKNCNVPVHFSDNKISFMRGSAFFQWETNLTLPTADVYLDCLSHLVRVIDAVQYEESVTIRTTQKALVFKAESFAVAYPLAQTSHYDDSAEIILKPKITNTLFTEVPLHRFRAALAAAEGDEFLQLAINAEGTYIRTAKPGTLILKVDQNGFDTAWEGIFETKNLLEFREQTLSEYDDSVKIETSKGTSKQPAPLTLKVESSGLTAVFAGAFDVPTY